MDLIWKTMKEYIDPRYRFKCRLKHVVVISKLLHQDIFTEPTCTFDQNKIFATTENMLTKMILSYLCIYL